MSASNPHIVDLRHQSSHSQKKTRIKRFSWWVALVVVLVVGIIIFCGGAIYGLNYLENKNSKLIQTLPSLAENLSNFEWQEASKQINAFSNKFFPEFLDRTFKTLVEKTPLGYHYKYVKLSYDLEELNQTIQLLQTTPVFKTPQQTSQSWGDVYPALLHNIANISNDIKTLGQEDLSQVWINLGEQLSKVNQLFGGNRPINYLLILNDSNQIRPLGGVVGGVVAVTISNWQVEYWRAYNASNLDNQISSKIIPPKEIQSITTNWTIRQSNWFGDIDLFTQSFISLWQKSSAGALFEPSAIVLFDSQDLKPLDTVLSNLNVDGNTVPNLRNYLENNLKNYRLTSGPLGDNYLNFVNDNLLPHLTTISGQEWLAVFKAYIQTPPVTTSPKYYFFPWKQASLAQTFNKNQESNFFWFTSSDINTPLSNLTSQNLKTFIKLEPKLGPDGYELNWTIGLTNSNKTSFSDYIRFYIPDSAVINSVSGLDKYLVPSDPINYSVKQFTTDPIIDSWEKKKNCPEGTNYCLVSEGKMRALAGWLTIKPGQTKTLKFSMELPTLSQSFTLIPQTAMINTLQIQNNTVLEPLADIQPYLNRSNSFNQTLLVKFIHD